MGRRVRVGESLLKMHGHVGRCLITSRDPDTGRDRPADAGPARLLPAATWTAPSRSPFGIYGEVLEKVETCGWAMPSSVDAIGHELGGAAERVRVEGRRPRRRGHA